MGENGKNGGDGDAGIRDGRGEYLVQRDGTLREFNAILQRDSTDTTYKYALLRALVEIAEQESHHVRSLADDQEWVTFPLGLIVERWLYYYYPFIDRQLPQRNGEAPLAGKGATLAFRRDFQKVCAHYRHRGGLSAFVIDLRSRGIPATHETQFLDLIRNLRHTITRYPMKHLGYSRFQSHYQVVTTEGAGRYRRLSGPLNREAIISGLGQARMRRRYYETFRAMGGLATGSEAIFAQWARFTARASDTEPVSLAAATEALLMAPIDERNVQTATQVYLGLLQGRGRLECVRSGKAIRVRDTLAIDHAIPFSLWGNNALWNLLPATPAVNNRKRDNIPAPELVAARSDRIVEYWRLLRTEFPRLFDSDFRMSLSGMDVNFGSADWEMIGVKSLQDKCRYLITERGFPSWAP